MLKYILLIIIFFSANLSLFSQDFRNVTWGMSKDEVKMNEIEMLSYDGNDDLSYSNVLINGLNTTILYSFINDQLCVAGYIFEENYINQNNYIVDYDDLKEILISKYGNPTKSDVYWINDLYRDEYQYWGIAVSMGYVEFSSSWELPNTRILLYLRGENFETTLTISYRSKIYSNMIEEKRKIDKAKDF